MSSGHTPREPLEPWQKLLDLLRLAPLSQELHGSPVLDPQPQGGGGSLLRPSGIRARTVRQAVWRSAGSLEAPHLHRCVALGYLPDT